MFFDRDLDPSFSLSSSSRVRGGVLGCCFDNSVHVFDPDGSPRSLKFFTNSFCCFTKQVSTQEFVVGCARDFAYLCSFDAGTITKRLVSYHTAVIGLATVSEDLFATGGNSADARILLWNLRDNCADGTNDLTDPTEVCSNERHSNSVWTLFSSPDRPHFLYSGSFDQSFRCWDLTQNVLLCNTMMDEQVYRIAEDEEHELIYVNTGSSIFAFDPRTDSFDREHPIFHLTSYPSRIHNLCSRQQLHQFFFSHTGKCYLYDVRRVGTNGPQDPLSGLLHSWNAHTQPSTYHGTVSVYGSDSMANGDLFLTSGYDDQTINAWSNEGHKLAWKWVGPKCTYGVEFFEEEMVWMGYNKTLAKQDEEERIDFAVRFCGLGDDDEEGVLRINVNRLENSERIMTLRTWKSILFLLRL